VDFDRQAIERRDFPIARRGYDPAAVDAHLRALASEFEELQRAGVSGGVDVSLASSAGTHVQSILEAAENAASEIERIAQDSARQVREAARAESERTREDALEKARAHVAAVAQVSTMLLERVGSMDSEVNALVASLRAGAGPFETALETAMDTAMSAPPAPEPTLPPTAPQGADTDLDGARLIALNMALNGESRTDTERYLAENFELPDRLKLIDEVYAAIEG